MIILGVDPGIGTTGFGVVRRLGINRFTFVECGCLKTSPKTPFPERLVLLARDFGALLDRIEPDEASVEKLFFGNNVTTAFAVGQARGVLILELARRGVAISEYSPPQIKQAVAGYGAATKAQVKAMVTRLLSMKKPPSPDDAADGLALALCHGFSWRQGDQVVKASSPRKVALVRSPQGSR